MKRVFVFFRLFFPAVFFLSFTPLGAQSWQKINTEHFTFIFQEEDAAVTQHFAALSEPLFDELAPYMKYSPTEKISIVINGQTDTFNGYFATAPDRIYLFLAPPDSETLGAYNTDHLKNLLVHELTHYLQFKNPQGILGFFSLFFGSWIQSLNMGFLPGWMTEGITTNTEGIFAEGGRAKNPYFEMTWKAPLLEGNLWGYDQAGYGSNNQPRGRIYSSGFFMVRYLRETYGEEKFLEIYHRFVSPLGFFPFVDLGWALKDETGLTPAEFYLKVVNDLQARYPKRPQDQQGELISPPRLGTWSLPYKTLKGWRGYASPQDRTSGIYDWGNGILPLWPENQEPLVPLAVYNSYNASVSLNGVDLIFTNDRTDIAETLPSSLTGKRDLWHKNLDTGVLTPISREGGWKNPTLSPDGRRWVAVKSHQPWTSLVMGDLDTGTQTILIQEQEGTLFEKPSFSPNGNQLVVVETRSGQQGITVIELATGEMQHLVVEGSALYEPRWNDSKSIVLGAELEGSLQAWLLDLATNQLTQLTSDPVGAFTALLENQRVLYTTWTSRGMALKSAAQPVGPFVEGTEVPKAQASEKITISTIPSFPSEDYIDVPTPYGWFPSLNFELSSSGFSNLVVGADIYGKSLLETQTFSLSVVKDFQKDNLKATVLYTNKIGSLSTLLENSFYWQNSETWWTSGLLRLDQNLMEDGMHPLWYQSLNLYAGLGGQLYSPSTINSSNMNFVFAGIGVYGHVQNKPRASLSFFGGTGLNFQGQSVYSYPWDSPTKSIFESFGSVDFSLGLGPTRLVSGHRATLYIDQIKTQWRYTTRGGIQLPLGLNDLYFLGSAWIRQGLTLWGDATYQPQAGGLMGWNDYFNLGVEFNSQIAFAGSLSLPVFGGIQIQRRWNRPFEIPVANSWSVYGGMGTSTF